MQSADCSIQALPCFFSLFFNSQVRWTTCLFNGRLPARKIGAFQKYQLKNYCWIMIILMVDFAESFLSVCVCVERGSVDEGKQNKKKKLDSRRINFSGAASCVYFALSGGASQLKIVLQSGDLGPGTLTGRILPSLTAPLPPSPWSRRRSRAINSPCRSQITAKRQFHVAYLTASPRIPPQCDKREEARPFHFIPLPPLTPRGVIKEEWRRPFTDDSRSHHWRTNQSDVRAADGSGYCA